MCGVILEISTDDHEQRKQCGTCRRRFEVQAAYDLASGRNELQVHYLTDQNERTGETCVIGSSTTIVNSTLYNCTCGSLLLLQKKHYEQRVRCPDCSARLLGFMLFDPAANAFSLQTFTLVDPPTGKTQVLPKL
jgi:DNA-directed RNA polymerase subunit RPC12/RpoP